MTEHADETPRSDAPPVYSFEPSDDNGYLEDQDTISITSGGETVAEFDVSDMTPDQVEDLRHVIELGQEVLPILKKLELFYNDKLGGKFTLDAYSAKLLFTFIMHQESMNEALQMQYAVVAHKADELQEELDQLQTRKLWRPKN